LIELCQNIVRSGFLRHGVTDRQVADVAMKTTICILLSWYVNKRASDSETTACRSWRVFWDTV